jgi:hypothetical protein
MDISGAKIITDSPIITISHDSYIRLTFEDLRRIPLVHLISGLDEDKPVLLQEGATFAEITGYTEWVSETTPTISVGWDWIIQTFQVSGGYYKRSSEPRSNLMLINSQQCDIGSIKCASLIETVIDEIDWQSTVQHYLGTRYTS